MSDQEKEAIIEEAVQFAAKALEVAFQATGLDSHIRSILEYPDGRKFFIEFKPVNSK